MKPANRPLFAATLSALLLVAPGGAWAGPKLPPKASLYAYAIQPFGFNSDSCYSLNNLGQVVGDSFVTEPNGKGGRLLIPPPGIINVVAKSINDSGVVVGSGLLDEVEFHWRPLVSGPNAEGFFITPGFTNEMKVPSWTRVNNSGQMIGEYYLDAVGDSIRHAIYSDDGGHTWRELLPIGGFEDIYAKDLNNLGQVIGYSADNPELDGVGFVTDANGVNPRLLQVPEGADFVIPYGINDAGQVAANAVREKATLSTTMWPYVTGANAVGASRLRAERPGSPQTKGYPAGIDDQGRTAGTVNIVSRYNGKMHWQSQAYVSGPGGRVFDVRDLIVNLPPEFDVSGIPDVNQRGQFLMTGSNGFSSACYLVCQHKDCDPY